jgi:hypothetical protein
MNICYTGPKIYSSKITTEDVRAFAHEAGRMPLIWDNFSAYLSDPRWYNPGAAWLAALREVKFTGIGLTTGSVQSRLDLPEVCELLETI